VGVADSGGEVSGWIADVMDRAGEVGVGVLIALENLFPPIPSEAILPLAGFRAQQGGMDPILAWVAATTGALVGALVLYAIGALVGYDRIHELAGKRWFVVLGQKDLERGDHFFEQHGGKIVLIGRCIPLVRSVVSVPAGISRMPIPRFVLFTVLGSAVWNALFITAGWLLGDNWGRVEGWIKPISYGVLALAVVAVLFLTGRKLRRYRTARAS
jgi:membrane protein DedA with SNARE-associated domain